MRIVFAGTPEFARRALAALLAAGHTVPLVLTQPDRKAGRGMRESPSPVKQLALEHDIPILQPARLNQAADLERLSLAHPDALVVAAYGLILPQAALDAAPLGAINIHASLLPRWRGAAPIQRALLAGDTISGISIMQMDAGLDTGAVIEREELPIADRETAGSLHDKLAALGSDLVVSVLSRAGSGRLPATPQPASGITYAHKIDKREAQLDWRKSSVDLDRLVRAFNPVPGARSTLNGTEIKVWQARPVAGEGEPGQVQSVGPDGVVVACGEGALLLAELQRAGGKRLSPGEFLLGHPVAVGSRFALAA